MCLSEFVEHALHLAFSVGVSGSAGGGDARLEALDGLGGSLHSGQRLSGHEVARGVVGIDVEQGIELGQRGFCFSAAGILHGQPVAGEAVVRVHRQNLFQASQFVHFCPCSIPADDFVFLAYLRNPCQLLKLERAAWNRESRCLHPIWWRRAGAE
uniref:Uncharacterized protein n=1 Tax=mine drainage metagenome TaxID=410659 RepID=E6Q006_9ZZZZ